MDYQAILAQIKPTKEEEKQLKQLAASIINKVTIPATKVILGGSGAKDTWLKGTHDIDIYVKFSYKNYAQQSEQLADILYKYVYKKLKVIRLHGSRDYFQLQKDGFMFEIVPILDITKPLEARNITDFSHLHVAYVKKHIQQKQKLADDIRLAKAFAKAQKVYGAESYIQGFSGYVMELLVIRYGSFEKLLKAVASWKKPVIIGNKKEAEQLNPAKKASPLILLDPVQPERNAAAALSEEKFEQFVKASRAFVKKPSLAFFEKKEVNLDALQKKKHSVFLNVTPLHTKKDIAGAKMMKAFLYLKAQIPLYGFQLQESSWDYEKGFFYFQVKEGQIAKEYAHQGPPVDHALAVQQFQKKYKDVFVQGKRLYAKKKRKFTDVRSLVQQLIRMPNVKERVQSIVMVA